MSVWQEEPEWQPLSVAELSAELQRSHPRYVVRHFIGAGGMGAVYLADDTHDGQRVAIKILRPDALADEAYVARFEREIANLRQLKHLNVVQILDDGVTPDGYRFFVMKFLEGSTLSEVLNGPRIPLHTVAQVMTDVCAGVQHAHEEGIVHRDLKASNIFVVSGEARTVVLDFGVARDVKRRSSTLSQFATPGTEGHVAPEVRQNNPATPISDVFSLGVIFLQMLTGEIPSVGHRMPSDFGLDPRLDTVVKKALSQHPADRYRSAAEFSKQIKVAIASEPDRIVAETPVIPVRADVPGTARHSEWVDVHFTDPNSIDRHKAYFKAWVGSETVLAPASPATRVGETWTVGDGDEWDASHDVPKRGDKQGVNPPALVGWSPDGERLFTACDAWGLRTWDVDEHRERGRDVDPWAYGHPCRIFVSQRGPDQYCVLQQTHSNHTAYYLLHDGEANEIASGLDDGMWSHATMPAPLNADLGFNPWRPGSAFELAMLERPKSYSGIKVVSVRNLPQKVAQPPRLWVALRAAFSGSPPEERNQLREAPALHLLEFSSLGAHDSFVFGFHWHPSGEYLAVNTGDFLDKEAHLRVHVVHLRTGQIVASIPTTSTALRWSPGGRYLLLKRWNRSSNGNLEAEAGVWDALAFETRFDDADILLSQPWAIRGLYAALDMPTSYEDRLGAAISCDAQRMLIDNARAITSVVREGCSVRPGEVLSRISETGFAHAAWSPVDPCCFATVGGNPSEKYPDTYKYYDRQHGRLARIWRLAARN